MAQQDKITVTWDDLKSRKVDQRLKEQDALARTREYSRMDENTLPAGAPAPRVSPLVRMWRNSVFAMALFGLIGGLLAWACGASLQFRASGQEDAARRMAGINRYAEMRDVAVRDRDDAVYRRDEALRRRDAAQTRNDTARVQLAQSELDQALRNIQAAQQIITQVPKYTELALAEGRNANEQFRVMADPTLADAEREQRLAELRAHDKLRQVISNILAYGLSGVILAIFLAIAMPVTERNLPGIIINGSVGAALGLLGGVVVALSVNRIYGAVVSGTATAGMSESGRQLLARVAVWGSMGLFLTLAPGVVMRNPKKFLIGLIGGLIGGCLGGVLYDPLYQATGQLRFAELAAMVAIGLFAGLSTGLIENVTKTGWVKVTQGVIAGKQFILYRNPTFVGSGPDCQIYLFKDPKVGRRHAAIHIVPGGFELEDLPLGTETLVNGKPVSRARLKNGDRVQIGSTQLIFQEKTPAA